MEFIYNYNGLQTMNEQDILLKEYLTRSIACSVQKFMKTQNKAFQFFQIESPSLIPKELINSNYTSEDVWMQEQFMDSTQLVLKPETTPATYAYMVNMLEHQTVMPPLCVWQVSKSFRREQDQPTKHCRFKEFYQQEFQCLYSSNTANDYQASIIDSLATMLKDLVGLPTRIVVSDRLPSYSIKTLDVEVFNGDKWMEICSCSVRNDFPIAPKIGNKEITCLVLEIAIGIDRLIYNIGKRSEVFDSLKTVENTTKEK